MLHCIVLHCIVLFCIDILISGRKTRKAKFTSLYNLFFLGGRHDRGEGFVSVFPMKLEIAGMLLLGCRQVCQRRTCY